MISCVSLVKDSGLFPMFAVPAVRGLRKYCSSPGDCLGKADTAGNGVSGFNTCI